MAGNLEASKLFSEMDNKYWFGIISQKVYGGTDLQNFSLIVQTGRTTCFRNISERVNNPVLYFEADSCYM